LELETLVPVEDEINSANRKRKKEIGREMRACIKAAGIGQANGEALCAVI